MERLASLALRLLRNRHGRVRALWRVAGYLASVSLLGLLAASASELLGVSAPGLGARSSVAYLLLCLAALLPALALLRLADRVDHGSELATLGLGVHPGLGRAAARGAGLGLCLIAVVWTLELGLGLYRLAGALRLEAELLSLLFVLFVAALLEELLFRGYLLQVMIQETGRGPGIAISSLVFGLAHHTNPDADALSTFNTALAGALLALVYARTRSLWPPTLLHLAWNYTLGPLLGTPVSGVELPTSLVVSELTELGRELWPLSGGEYGPEGGLVLTVLLVPLIAWLWVRGDTTGDAIAEIRPLWLREEARAAAEIEAKVEEEIAPQETVRESRLP